MRGSLFLDVQSNLFRTITKGPTGFVCNNGSSSYPYRIPSEYTVIYPIELQILVLLKRKFVLSVFFLTSFHCTYMTRSGYRGVTMMRFKSPDLRFYETVRPSSIPHKMCDHFVHKVFGIGRLLFVIIIQSLRNLHEKNCVTCLSNIPKKFLEKLKPNLNYSKKSRSLYF